MPAPKPRPRARSGPPIVPIVIAIVACAGLAYAWSALSKPAPSTDAPSAASLLAAADGGDEEAFRALAGLPPFAGGEAMALRQRLAAAVRPLLSPATRTPLLTAAVAAAARHRCDGLAVATVELLGADPAIADRIGGAAVAADLIVHIQPDQPEAPRFVAGLAKLVGNGGAGRAAATRAMQNLNGESWMKVPGFTACLDALAAGLPDPACLETLRHLAVNVCRRPERVAQLGSDAAAWKDWLQSDGERTARCAEIRGWLQEHGSADRVADGPAKLEEHRRFLVLAQRDIGGWLSDPAWQGPLGFSRGDLEDMSQRVNQAMYANRAALGGTGTQR